MLPDSIRESSIISLMSFRSNSQFVLIVLMKSAFSSKVMENELIVVDSISMDEYKTKKIVAMLSAIGAEKKALIVLPEVDSKVIKSANNIPGVKTAQVNTLNVYDILNADKLIIVKDAVSKIEEVYA